MKLTPRNQTSGKQNRMDDLSTSMANFVISPSARSSSSTQVKSLRMPSENEIKQVHLNIKLGNRQPSEALRKKHGIECHYLPPPMAVFEPAIRAVSENRTAGLVDTGSQVHVSGDSNMFISKEPLEQLLELNLASPSFHVYASHRGKMKLPFTKLAVNNVLFCEKIPGTLISLGQLVDEGYRPKFIENDLWVYAPEGDLFFYARFENRSWVISPVKPEVSQDSVFDRSNKSDFLNIKALNVSKAFQWHFRLGHASDKVVKCFLKNYVPDFDMRHWSPFVCKDCLIAKSTRRHLPAHDDAPKEQPRDLMMSYVLGPMPIVDIHQNRYILTLRDHFSTFVFCFPIKTRDQVPKMLLDTFHLIKSVFGNSAKFLRTDNAKEYMGQNFRISLTAIGTQQLFSCPYTPEQNGEAERLNRTLGDAARTMLRSSGLPTTFWSYAYKCAAYIHNRIPNTRTGNSTPLEIWGRLCSLVGFQDDSRGYYFWDDDLKQVINSNHAKFLDFKHETQSDKMKITNLVNKIHLKLGKEETDEICEKQDSQIEHINMVTDMAIPTTLNEAKKSNWEKWRGAIEHELNSFDEMEVWELVERTKNMKVINTKFVFDLKKRGQADLVYKARLVARGFSMALKNNWDVASFDVSVAYLHSSLDEIIYVDAPAEFRPHWKNKVMRLRKAMYGLKQAGRCWWFHFRSVMIAIGFCAEELDQCVYKCMKGNTVIYVWMHVDDGVVFSNQMEGIVKVRKELTKHLKLRWEDNLSRIVGIDVLMNNNTITLSQSSFARQIVEHYENKANIRLLNMKTTLPDMKLETSGAVPIEQKWYQSLIGSLNYLALGTRPDISFAVNYLARYSNSPQNTQWHALQHLLGYVKYSMDFCLKYEAKANGLQVWTDADWGGEFQRSTTGFVFRLFGCTIAWASRRQKLVATSTFAAELIAMGMTSDLLSFIIQILHSIDPTVDSTLFCDNKASMMVLEGSKTRIKSLE
ncbi:hypothetical protein O181_043174 [Austropuccinia psidii MF-1]|uniref:Integrase catalytic domain-containing protein n=1 Tax=Austropuccinia psidii MF-1 TaxID=1389203 RepID=A0A9Q3DHS6_9BASI|nr:hypothetical protein [Austropuccinia psidii MF-1]